MGKPRDPRRFLPDEKRSPTTTYQAWQDMKKRCCNKKTARYPRYGGRGITVCARWRSFDHFFQDMGPCPPGMTLERVDLNGNYEPGNCIWADRKTQANNKSNNRWLQLDGKLLTMRQWSEQTGIPYGTLVARLRMGWDVRRALTQPARRNRRLVRGQLIELNGERRTLTQWADKLGIRVGTLHERIAKGWEPERAISSPLVPTPRWHQRT